MIKQITAGVPTISVDLPSVPQDQQAIIKGWLGIYNEHLDTLVKGTLEPQTGAMDVWMTTSDDTAIVSLLHNAKEFTFPADKKKVVVLNGTGNEDVYVRLPAPLSVAQENKDHFTQVVDRASLTLVDKGSISIPSAGLAVFTVE